MTKIFISHSSKDSVFAVELARLLTKMGCDVWIDLAEAPAVRKPSPDVEIALEGCEIILVIVSPDAMASFRVQDEWKHALGIAKRLLPIIWRPAGMPDVLQVLPVVDFHTSDFRGAMARLRTELGLTERADTPGKLHAVHQDSVRDPEMQLQGGTYPNVLRFTWRTRRVLNRAEADLNVSSITLLVLSICCSA